MGKSVYSLVLDDGLVACVDRLAYEKMTNRSVMINQILAAHFRTKHRSSGQGGSFLRFRKR